MHPARIAFVLLLSLGACKSTCASTASKPTEDAAAPDAAAATVNAAYIVSRKVVTIVADGQVTELDSDRWEWKRALGSDGSLYVAGDGVRRIRGEVTTKLSSAAAFDIAVGPDGRVWVTDQVGVLVLDGDKTKMIPMSTPQSKVVATPRGPVFAEGTTISTLEGDVLKKDEEASRLLTGLAVRAMTAAPNGEVFIVTMMKFVRRDAAGTWHEHMLTDLGFTLAVGRASPKGKVPLVTSEAIVLIGPDGAVQRQALDLPGDLSDITAIAVDGSDRLWISATFGLFVFGPDGKLLQQWPSGALPTSAQEILIVGDGPPLPKTPPPAIKGLVQGTAIVDGKPVPNATVEMIADPALAGFERAKVRLTSKTNDAGQFTFLAVPRQEYALTYKSGEQHLSANISKCCSDFTPGETRDLGQVELR